MPAEEVLDEHADQQPDDRLAVVVTGADAIDPRAVAAVPDDALVIAADGGLDHALAAGLTPHVLVGDLDSVSADGRAWAETHAEIVVHPADKAATDTELALAHAVATGARRLLLVAGAGDRLDHSVAAIGALGGPLTETVAEVGGWWGPQRLHVVRPDRPVELALDPGATFSVLALHGPCRGVDVAGARWPLDDADLGPVVGLGVSNEAATPPVSVRVRTGVLTVIVPGGHR